MTFTEQMIWLAGSTVKCSRQIGSRRVYECTNEPLLDSERVKQFTGELTQTVMHTTHGAMASVYLGKDIVCWPIGGAHV